MRLTIPEPKIEIGKDGFEGNDLLGRAGLGQKLTELVDKIDDPIVIAIDGGWGSGKSFFLKLWVGAHSQEFGGKAQVIYFDAFEHDFLDDPLIGLIGAISTGMKGDTPTRAALKKLKSAAALLAKPITHVALAYATSGATGIVGGLADAAISATSGELSKAVDQFWKREDGKRAAMLNFRAALQKLTKPDANGEPTQKIVLIVDELDRCRPDYALLILETIKHFFTVQGVHFVLGVHLNTLENSVKAHYGSGIEAAGYLQKFIHLTMPLTTSKSEATALHYFNAVSAKQGIGAELCDHIRQFLDLPGIAAKMSVRDVQRLMTRAVLLPADFQGYHWPYQYIALSAIFLSILFPKHYPPFRLGSLPFATFATDFGLSEPQDSTTGLPDSLWHLSNYWLSADPVTSKKFIGQLFINMNPNRIRKEFEHVLSDSLDTFTLQNQPVA